MARIHRLSRDCWAAPQPIHTLDCITLPLYWDAHSSYNTPAALCTCINLSAQLSDHSAAPTICSFTQQQQQFVQSHQKTLRHSHSTASWPIFRHQDFWLYEWHAKHPACLADLITILESCPRSPRANPEVHRWKHVKSTRVEASRRCPSFFASLRYCQFSRARLQLLFLSSITKSISLSPRQASILDCQWCLRSG